jgi:hypothetical protein
MQILSPRRVQREEQGVLYEFPTPELTGSEAEVV